jgi:[protein-PII] uridylyltransferase
MTATPLPSPSEATASDKEALQTLRQRFRESKAQLLAAFAQSRPTVPVAQRLIRALAKHVDETLCTLCAHTQLPASITLVAVGGYGRGELFPYSDVDVLLLLPPGQHLPRSADEAPSSLNTALERFVTACWDIGLELGSSVRSLDECVGEAQRDVTVQTALLESRFVWGSRHLFKQFRHANTSAMDARVFLRAKTLEMQQRHQRFEDTPYSLEPNCKESPGGLRDLQVLMWVARAAGLGKTWAELAVAGLLTPFEVQQLQRNEGVLKLIRARLHIVAGRREDRLVFDLQTAVANSFGYTSESSITKPVAEPPQNGVNPSGSLKRSSRSGGLHRPSEMLMRRYYWAAKAVVQLNQILLMNMAEQVNGSQHTVMKPLVSSYSTADFLERDGTLEVVSDDLYQRDPQAILRTFLVYEQFPSIRGLSARTLRALYNARKLMDSKFRNDPVNRATFMQILMQPEGQTHAFRLMNQTSVLGRYLWVFRRIVGQMQHDLFHVYTVDQHILMVLRNVRRFFIPEHAHEYPFCSQLASSWDEPHLLYIAALFHDVAKGRGGDHSDLGSIEVKRFARSHGLSADDTALVQFLVKHHLTMSNVAQKSDLSEPQVIEDFAKLVGTERRLTALYLLTVADIRGTSPKVWNAWKAKLIEDLYRFTLRALGGTKPNLDADIESCKAEARQFLNLHSLLPGTEEALWKTLEVSYFARHDASDIAWHARVLFRHLKTDKAVVCARLSPVGVGLQVLVYAKDRSDLFARICGYFDGGSFNIWDAKVHTTRTGYALDTFQITSPEVEAFDAEQQPHAYRDWMSLVENQLAAAIDAPTPLPEPSQGRLSRRVKSFPVTPRIALRPDERAQRWLLDVSANDRSGLLYAIARVLARYRINLQLAKITTLGERVEDTFLIDGEALQQNRLQLQIEGELLDAMGAG